MKVKEELRLLRKLREAVHQCGVHGEHTRPIGTCPEELRGCIHCPITKAHTDIQYAERGGPAIPDFEIVIAEDPNG